MRILVLALAVAATALTPAAAQTPAATPPANPSSASTAGRDRVDQMFRDRRASADWFTSDLLARTSLAEIDAAISRISTALGSYLSVDGYNGDYIARFDRGTDEVFVHVNGDEKIDYLFFRSPMPSGQ